MTERWCHFELWVQVGDELGQASPDVLENLVDTLAEFVFAAGEDFEFDPHVSGQLNGPPPDWVVVDTDG